MGQSFSSTLQVIYNTNSNVKGYSIERNNHDYVTLESTNLTETNSVKRKPVKSA